MKNKILLSSVTLLSALMVAACGNGEKKTGSIIFRVDGIFPPTLF